MRYRYNPATGSVEEVTVEGPARPAGPFIQGDMEPYKNPTDTRKVIDGRKAHREALAAAGCRVLEPSERSSVLGPNQPLRRE